MRDLRSKLDVQVRSGVPNAVPAWTRACLSRMPFVLSRSVKRFVPPRLHELEHAAMRIHKRRAINAFPFYCSLAIAISSCTCPTRLNVNLRRSNWPIHWKSSAVTCRDSIHLVSVKAQLAC